jgi:hypothetical protein
LGEEQQRYSTAQYDARSQLVDLLAGIEAGYANAQRSRAGQQAGAANTAFGNAVQFGYQPQQQAPAAQVAGGMPVYPGNLVSLNIPGVSEGAPQRRNPLPTSGTKLGSGYTPYE